MVHRSMRDDLKVADKLYIKGGCSGVEGFPFLLSLLVHFDRNVNRRCWNSFDSCLGLILWEVLRPHLFSDITLLLAILPISDLVYHIWTSPTCRTWYFMCLHPSPVCKYCLEPCSVFCWVDLAWNQCWLHIWDDCVELQPWFTGFNIHRYPHQSPYSENKICPWLYIPNELCWSQSNSSLSFWTRSIEHFQRYQSHNYHNLWGGTSGGLFCEQSNSPSLWNTYWTDAAREGGGLDITRLDM